MPELNARFIAGTRSLNWQYRTFELWVSVNVTLESVFYWQPPDTYWCYGNFNWRQCVHTHKQFVAIHRNISLSLSLSQRLPLYAIQMSWIWHTRIIYTKMLIAHKMNWTRSHSHNGANVMHDWMHSVVLTFTHGLFAMVFGVRTCTWISKIQLRPNL